MQSSEHNQDDNQLSTSGYWEGVWSGDVRLRLPSGYVVSTKNLQRLLRRYVRPGHRFLEIGCAPGKMLAWVASELRADVSGLDYSARGLATARTLFQALGLTGDLRCEDLQQTTFAEGTFDVVYSAGLIEHFADPREIVNEHLRLVRPGGTAVITVPNYGGLYGSLQRYFDAENLSIHNLDIMSGRALEGLVTDSAAKARAFPAGRLSPWLVSVGHRWPAALSAVVCHTLNGLALIQPFDIPALCPMLVLEIRKPS
jgi:2-polyprenyl-3-methyl-5-hydroxy-6-metoxy-1,4-benzoquinol methylase